jgi:carbon monoxide dehydrogenase subunit G
MIFEDRFTVKAPIERCGYSCVIPSRSAMHPGHERVEVVDDTHTTWCAGARVGILSVSFALNVTSDGSGAPAVGSCRWRRNGRPDQGRVKITSAITWSPYARGDRRVSYHIDLVVFGKLAARSVRR